MAEDLHRLVYYSRNRIDGGEEVLGQAIDDILTISRRNNAARGVTGALMFNAGCFGQVIEGRRDVLLATFQRIQKDARHGDVSLLSFEPIDQRTFPSWSMGFVGHRPSDEAAFAHVARDSGFDLSQATGDTLLKALHDLTIEDEARRDGGRSSAN